MFFHSYIFILLFMPLVIILYYFFNHINKPQLAKMTLIAASIIFISYANLNSLYFLFFSTMLTYLCAMLQRKYHNVIHKKIVLTVGILSNVGMLAYYKYTEFAIYNLNKYLNTAFSIDDILVPLGISFVTFGQISFLVDIYRNNINKLSFLDYAFYVSYFPKYVQGPITKYNDLVTQINHTENRKFIPSEFSQGIWLFVNGLARKVLLADVLSKAVSWGYGYSIDHMSAVDALIVSLCFTFQIYFDFSGYSYMAIGISKMFNITLPDNFDSPYQAKSINEFWQKWHISLTSFLREYLYFPLGGNRKGKIRTYINLFLIFSISGLWHGASWNYILWGILQGAACCLERIFHKQWIKLSEICRWFLTFSFVNISWIFFRTLSVSQAIEVLQKIARMENTAISSGLIQCFRTPEINFLSSKFSFFASFLSTHNGFELWGMLVFAGLLALNLKDKYEKCFKPTITKCICTILLFSWSIMSLSTVVEFIYVNF